MVYPFSEEYTESSHITKDNKVAGRDDVLVEQLKNIIPKVVAGNAKKYFMENKIPIILRQFQNNPIWKPGKDCNSKELPTISLVCHTNSTKE